MEKLGEFFYACTSMSLSLTHPKWEAPYLPYKLNHEIGNIPSAEQYTLMHPVSANYPKILSVMNVLTHFHPWDPISCKKNPLNLLVRGTCTVQFFFVNIVAHRWLYFCSDTKETFHGHYMTSPEFHIP